MSITTLSLKKLKEQAQKFSCVTAYDSTFSSVACESGIDVLLIGDSLGMVLQGQDSTLPVSMDDMIYHTQCVKQGATNPLIMADMPFNSINTLESTLNNAGLLMQAGAHIVKLEGGEWLAEYVSALSDRGIPVCAHLGLTPQSVNKLGGYRVQGKEADKANSMINAAKLLEQAGADIISVVAAFTATTGKAHWQALLQARAIEQQCYILASNQWGQHDEKRQTFGHSMVISPWGEVLDQLPTGQGVASAEIDLAEVQRIRSIMPIANHQRSL